LTTEQALLDVHDVRKYYGSYLACKDISFDLYPGEVISIVGESGSGKTTLLKCLSGELKADSGQVNYFTRQEGYQDILEMSEPRRRMLMREDWGYVQQNPADGLRMNVSAGANIGERLMARGDRHYGKIREQSTNWLQEVEIDADRVDHMPTTFSGGMRQRLQISRNLVTHPRLILMDEPTGGLDVSVQARLLDLLRRLVSEMKLAAIVVTHDLSVARLLSHRMIVMKSGSVVEAGLTDQVLDDPQHAYSQLLVSSILRS